MAGEKVVQKALKAVSEMFDSPGMTKWREKSVIPASKVEDRYYTGTSKDKDFPNFKVEGHGAWFTKDPATASMYAAENDSKGFKREGWDMVPVNTADRVIPAYLRAENPFTGPLPESAMSDNYKKAQTQWFDQLRAQGHDAWMPESDPNLAVILKNQSDIKSALSNTGDFDLGAPRIDRADGGHVDAALHMLRRHFTSGGTVEDALHAVRRHFDGSDGSYVDSNRSMRSAIASIDPEASQDQPVMDPATMGEAWSRARRNYQNFPVQEGEATARQFTPSVRQEIGAAIAGEGGGRDYGSELRRRTAEFATGSSGLDTGIGALDFVPYAGQALGATDIAHDIGQGDYAGAAEGAALPVAMTAAQKFAGPIGRGLSYTGEKIAEHARPIAGVTGTAAALAPEDAEAAKFEPIRRLLAMGMKPSEIEMALQIAKEHIPTNHPTVMWHGTPSGDLRGGSSGLHLGTHEAARQALNARIGMPAEGNWTGLRVYGETPIAGERTILSKGRYGMTGYNARPPMEDYLPTEQLKYANGQIMPMDVEPVIYPFRIIGEMSNKPYAPMSDVRANATMQGMLKKGQAKRGYYYGNEGEDVGLISAVVPGPHHVQPIDLERLLRTGEYADGGSVEDRALMLVSRQA